MHDEGRHARPHYADVAPYPTASRPEPADAATSVFSAYEAFPAKAAPAVAVAPAVTRAPFNPAPAPPAVMPPVVERRAAHRRLSTTTAKGNTVVSATAALGAVVTGGLLASQATGMAALADAAGNAPTTDTTTMAAAAMAPLTLQPASSEAPLSSTGLADSGAATALLPVAGARDASMDQRDVEALHKGEALAQQAAAVHAAAVREANILNGGGGLNDWIDVALDKLGLDQSYSRGVYNVIMKESRGNPHAVNRWDSNAMAGRPSQGLMQVIPSTFRAYVLPELAGRPITDPVANITAGIRYMIANYGLGTLRQGGRYSGGSYVGY